MLVKIETAVACTLGLSLMGYGALVEQAQEEALASMPAMATTANPMDLPRMGDAGVQVPALYVAVGAVVAVSALAIHVLSRTHKQTQEYTSKLSDQQIENSVKLAVAVEQCTDASKACATALERCVKDKE